jgi:molecular chaperone GrpE
VFDTEQTGKQGENTRTSADRPDSAGAGTAVSIEEASKAIEEIRQQLARLEAEKKDLTSAFARRQADFDNYRKRIERERLEDSERAVGALLHQVLPVLDDFERALQAVKPEGSTEFAKGVELIYRRLWSVLEKQGLKRMETTGRRFDPHLHHAIERIPTSEVEDGTIIGEFHPGYFLHERVLRPALVRVAVHELPGMGETNGEEKE